MVSTALHDLYRRWLDELWNGDPGIAHKLVSPGFIGHWPDRDVTGPDELAAIIGQTQAMLTGLAFTLEVGPIVEGDLVAGRWIGHGHTSNGEMQFIGNDILRAHNDRFIEYWTATSTGS